MLGAFEHLRQHPGTLILIGHGGVGSLLWCALAGQPISRKADQPGQGHIWQMAFDPMPRPLHPWQSFETTRL
jgi:broad specificity phosphatase PhoE